MNGKVIFSSGSEYKVFIDEKIFSAKAAGILKLKKQTILVGDNVEVDINQSINHREDTNIIRKVLPRKNVFQRPAISNVDNIILFSSVKEPDPSFLNIDKLIMIFQTFGIKPILVFTKKDLGLTKEVKHEINTYKKEYDVFLIERTIEDEELKKFSELIKDKFNIITGVSGVGKSTFINSFLPNVNVKVSSISIQTNRGKHTTTSSKAFNFNKNTFLVDTPGFSAINLDSLTKEDISWNFFNFQKYVSKCKMKGCLHIKEENCEIKRKVKELEIPLEKYENYLKLQKLKK